MNSKDNIGDEMPKSGDAAFKKDQWNRKLTGTSLPTWPNDFRFSSAGIPHGYDCIQIWEISQSTSWQDNYFCWKKGKKNPGLRWSSAGPINGMRCTRTYEVDI